MNEELAAILVTNLLKNAFLHSPEGGKILIYAADGTIFFTNSGSEPLDSTRLFHRFYKQGKTGNTGLGLALVGSIARSYKMDVRYSFEDGRHIFALCR